MPVPDPDRAARRPWALLAALNPYLLAALMMAAGLALAPRIYHNYDVVDCFLTWSRASGGSRPWDIYRTDCDYPPLVPYMLTLVERLRLAARAPEVGTLSLTYVKLPMLAYLAGVPLLLHGLRRPFGERAARLTAVLFALCLPLFINAAAWGQFDALLSLWILAALVALLNERPVWAGVALGLGLATKLLAIVALPTAGVWAWRRFGPKALGKSLGAAVLVLMLLGLPHILGGGGKGMASAYTGALNYYPFRTVEAYNGWYLLDRFDIYVRGMPARQARMDTRHAFGPVSFRHLGLAAFAAYTLFLTAALARRPTPDALVLATAMGLFAFFMLPTQMHQRYIVPAAALMVLLAPRTRAGLVLFLGLTATASLNQALDLGRAALDHAVGIDPAAVTDPSRYRVLIRAFASLVAMAHVGLFVWGTVAFWRDVVAAPAAPSSARPAP